MGATEPSHPWRRSWETPRRPPRFRTHSYRRKPPARDLSCDRRFASSRPSATRGLSTIRPRTGRAVTHEARVAPHVQSRWRACAFVAASPRDSTHRSFSTSSSATSSTSLFLYVHYLRGVRASWLHAVLQQRLRFGAFALASPRIASGTGTRDRHRRRRRRSRRRKSAVQGRSVLADRKVPSVRRGEGRARARLGSAAFVLRGRKRSLRAPRSASGWAGIHVRIS
jgi:hypothetical protein